MGEVYAIVGEKIKSNYASIYEKTKRNVRMNFNDMDFENAKERDALAAPKNKYWKFQLPGSDMFAAPLFHQGLSCQKSYQHSLDARGPRSKIVDIYLICIFHSTTACCIMTLLFEIHRCVSCNVGYIFIRYCLSSKTFQ